MSRKRDKREVIVETRSEQTPPPMQIAHFMDTPGCPYC